MAVANPKELKSQNGNRTAEHVIEVVEEAPIMTGAQITCAALEAEGVTEAFGYPGGAVIPFYDAFPTANLHHILVRFEQWAAMAAAAFSALWAPRSEAMPSRSATTRSPPSPAA